MSYQLTLSITKDSIAGRNIETLTAALRLIEDVPQPRATRPADRRILDVSREDAALLDEALDIALQDRERRNGA